MNLFIKQKLTYGFQKQTWLLKGKEVQMDKLRGWDEHKGTTLFKLETTV